MTPRTHEWDDDGCCEHCGFDGAEWHWWKNSTYEGRAAEGARMPECKLSAYALQAMAERDAQDEVDAWLDKS